MAISIKEIECFVFDMDGTINLGDSLIPGSLELIETIKKLGKKFFFFTNNSSKSPEKYVDKLRKFGFSGITRQHIMTSGDVMIHYLKKHFGNSPYVYLSATPDLEQQFQQEGVRLFKESSKEKPDAVVIAFDTTFNFHKATTACMLISSGVPFLATNIDKVCPLENEAYLPDCGSICCMLTHATGIEPKFTGKPFRETVDYILAAARTIPQKTAMIGDRLYTDIATAVSGGIVGIAVLTGEVTLKEIQAQNEIQPDYILNSVADILYALKEDC